MKLIYFACSEEAEENLPMNENISKPSSTVIDASVPEHALCMEWSIRIWGRDVEIVNIEKARALYPMALLPDCLSETRGSFPSLMETLILKPVLMQLNSWLQEEFERDAKFTELRLNAAKSFDESLPDLASMEETIGPRDDSRDQTAERRKVA